MPPSALTLMLMCALNDDPTGRYATSVRHIPIAGWLQILVRTARQNERDKVMIVSAGVAFFFLLALVPALTSFAVVVSIVADPASVIAAFNEVETLLPDMASSVLRTQIDAVLAADNQVGALSVKAIIGLLLSFWFAGTGVRAMMEATTVAYRERETRNPIVFYLTAFALTLGALLIGVIAVSAFVALPITLSLIDMADYRDAIVRIVRWPIFVIVVCVGLSVTYRYGPSRRGAKAKWLTVGAFFASVLWLVGSLLFTTYVEHIADFAAVHGTLSAIVVLLLWFWFTAFVAILGAELNAEIEHQTSVDTTVGRDRPIGMRGAFVADHVATSSTD